jgi:hypothetical protein
MDVLIPHGFGPSRRPYGNAVSLVDEDAARRRIGRQLRETYLKSAVRQRRGEKRMRLIMLPRLAHIEKRDFLAIRQPSLERASIEPIRH